jgi:class 3 adenylate cyclase
MALLEELNGKIDAYVKQLYEIEETTIVPDTDTAKLTFGNKGLTCEYAFLFMDIRKSSQLHEQYGFTKAAKIYQSFHDINVRVIEENSGSVRAFDGDRVMGVFVGASKNSNAVKAAMQIQWAIRNILNPKLETKITCGGGIDYGKILVTKIGKGRNKNNNDLVWIGKADNYASHLANEAKNTIIISTNSYDVLVADRKVSDGKNMWQSKVLTLKNGTNVKCYESSYGWVIK